MGKKTKTSFKPGQSGNPKGRPKTSMMKELNDAIEKSRKENNKSILEHFVERAYKNDGVLTAVVNKLIANKMKTEIEGIIEIAEPLIIKIQK